MRQPRPLTLAWTMLVVFVGGFVVYTQLSGSSAQSTPNPAPSQIGTTARPLSSSTPTPSGEDGFDEGAAVNACEEDLKKIRERSTLLAIEWMKVLPNDTFADRASRLRPYVAEDLLRDPQFRSDIEPDTTSHAGEARKRQGISQLAAASNEEIQPVCVTNLGGVAATDVTVLVWTEDPSGREVLPPSPSTLSINWQLTNQVWRATSVTE